MRKYIILYFFCFSLTIVGQKKGKFYQIRTVAFYNLENLFDTINDLNKDDESSPIMKITGPKSKVYWDKIDKLGWVIAQIGKEKSKSSPVLIGVAEAENRGVLEDLIKSEHLQEKGYQIIHRDSPDRRGIDVALLYQHKFFIPLHDETINPNIYLNNRKIYTRDQLLVSGYLDGELIHIIINHWPSRRGSESASRPMREKAAYYNTKIIERLHQKEDNPKVILMGDFNDDPISSSFKNVLQTKRNKENLKDGDLYNPYEKMFRKGYNTLVYRDKMNLFDQIIISSSLVNKKGSYFENYKLYQAHIFNKRFLTTQKGKFKGYPFRSFSNGSYAGGYSDHYPVYIHLIRQKN